MSAKRRKAPERMRVQDRTEMDLFRLGTRNRAATFVDRRKKESKNFCRKMSKLDRQSAII